MGSITMETRDDDTALLAVSAAHIRAARPGHDPNELVRHDWGAERRRMTHTR